MENASKALIIAGAILLAILLIGLGMIIFNMGRSTTDTLSRNMDQFERIAFNNTYEQYRGERVTGSKVQALVSQVIANTNEDMPKVKLFKGTNEVTSPSAYASEVKTGKTYKVVLDYDTYGTVNKITITENP